MLTWAGWGVCVGLPWKAAVENKSCCSCHHRLSLCCPSALRSPWCGKRRPQMAQAQTRALVELVKDEGDEVDFFFFFKIFVLLCVNNCKCQRSSRKKNWWNWSWVFFYKNRRQTVQSPYCIYCYETYRLDFNGIIQHFEDFFVTQS